MLVTLRNTVIGLNKKRSDRSVALSFYRLLFCSLFINLSGFAGPGDSLRKIYAPEDPRNPDCLCHNYQRTADKEFKSYLKKLERERKETDTTTVNSDVKKKNLHKIKRRSAQKHFQRRGHAQKLKQPGRRKHTLRSFFAKDISACTH
jgi:hypothetical protein